LFDNSTRTVTYDTDLSQLRSQLINVPGIRGVAFRVSTLNNQYVGFRGLTRATFVNDGVYAPTFNISDFPNLMGYNLDVNAGDTADYYLQLIRTALNNLGFNIAPCQPPTP